MANDDRDVSDSAGSSSESGLGEAVPSTERASGYGVTLTLVGAVLLAFAYYGVVAVQGPRQLGSAIPEPFYGLAIALLFVIELLQRGTLSAVSLARALALAAGYGTLFVLAVEGGAYLWEQPQVALANFAGVTVFAVSLVVAALVYVGYLTVLEMGTGE